MKKELKNILVPIDFKPPSIQAFHYALKLADQIKGNIFLLSILETQGVLANLITSGMDLVKLSNSIKDKLQDIINTVSDKQQDINISTIISRGKPYQKILDTAEEIGARMIILGENHQETGENQNLGSTVYHVTLKSPVPMLTLKGSTNSMNNKIVVPLDLTKETRKQLFSALVYGLNYHTEIHLVSALIGGIKMRDSRIYKKLKQAKRTLNENGVICVAKSFPRSSKAPYNQVLEYANEINAGMILVLTHQEGFTYDNYIGAFAHHIINKSSVPVLSLTASATNVNYYNLLQSIVDPAGILQKKH